MLADSLDLRPATAELYRGTAERYVIPGIGDRPIGSITTRDLRAFYASLDRRGVGRPTIEICHRLISRVLNQALDDELIGANPAARAKAPRAERKTVSPIALEHLVPLAWALEYGDVTPDDAAEWQMLGLAGSRDMTKWLGWFLEYRRRWRTGYGVMALTTAFTGLRFSEVAAMRASRVKLGNPPWHLEVVDALTEVGGKVSIAPTKTKSSVRVLPIHGQIGDILATHMIQRHIVDNELLFTTKTGLPLGRSRFRSRTWEPAIEAARIPHATFHHLRHTCGAWLISTGATPQMVQERLGHTSIRTTIDTYGHLVESVRERQAAAEEDALRGTYVAREPVASSEVARP